MRHSPSFRSTLALPVLLTVVLAACGKDETAPIITLIGDPAVTLEFGDTFADPGATVTDDEDDDVSVVVSGTVDTSALGDYTLSYDATDEAGNTAATVTRTVSVVDTIAPIIVLNGDATEIVLEGEDFVDPGATVTDAADPGVSVEVAGTVDTTTAGTYVLTYSATDASGNVAASVDRTVEVVFDGELFVVSDGADLVLVGVDVDGTISERSRATFPFSEQYNSNHLTFDVVVDPSSGDLFATSFNDCPGDVAIDAGCWGNGRIDRYRFDANTITHEATAFLAQGPLRAGRSTYDAGTEVLTLPLYNQSKTVMAVTSVAAGSGSDVDAIESACDGQSLQPSASCDIVFRGVGVDDYLEDEVVADFGSASGAIRGAGETGEASACLPYGLDF